MIKLTLLAGDNCKACRVWEKELEKAGYQFEKFNIHRPTRSCVKFQRENKIFIRTVPALVALGVGANRKAVYHSLSYHIKGVIKDLNKYERSKFRQI